MSVGQNVFRQNVFRQSVFRQNVRPPIINARAWQSWVFKMAAQPGKNHRAV
jgi:hypothetical protein